MYKTILAAIDDSEFSRAALVESANWIKRHGGNLILFHGVFFDSEEFSNAPGQLDKRIELGKAICQKAQDFVLSEFGIKAELVVREGEPPEIIADIAAERNADVITIGTHGRRGLKRLIMGSVASSVILNSPCDVLVVKKPCSECTGTYSSILVSFDGSEFSRNALVRACRLSKVDSAAVTVLYVIPRYQEMIGFFKSESIKESLYQEAKKIIDAAKEIASGQGVNISTEIEEGNASDEIVETAARLESDLIIMGTHGWRGVNKVIMGSTTERVIMNASIPVLTVR